MLDSFVSPVQHGALVRSAACRGSLLKPLDQSRALVGFRLANCIKGLQCAQVTFSRRNVFPNVSQ